MSPMHRLGLVLCMAAALGAALAARANPPAPPAPAAAPASPASAPAFDLQKRFPDIRRQLASDDYPQRQAGQTLLDAIPPAQVEGLRALVAAETDPEVKARLEDRISAMDIYLLIHPPGVSLYVKDATLPQVCDELARQLGPDVQLVSGGGAQTFSVQADNLPFWEVVNQLNRQSPLLITSGTTIGAGTTKNTLRLTPSPAPREYQIVDSFLLNTQMTGSPAAGTWFIRVAGNADPRVRITQYSQLRIDKLTDQDGASLIPLLLPTSSVMASSLRPMSYWTSSATLAASPATTRLKELRGSIALSILEIERTVTLDLTKEVAPVDTARGQITVDKNGPNGNFMIRFTPPPADPAALPAGPVINAPAIASALRLTVRVFDKDDRVIQTMYTAGSQFNIALAANNPPAKVELTWTEKSRAMTLPIVLHDVPLPPAPAVVNPVILPR